MSDCMYCEENDKLKSLMIKICDLSFSTLYLFKDQNHKGRCIVACKKHVHEIFELSDEERNMFFADVAKVAKAQKELFGADKINYGIFGDKMPHFHVHMVPKYEGALQWGGFFNDAGITPKYLSDEEYAALMDKIKAAVL